MLYSEGVRSIIVRAGNDGNGLWALDGRPIAVDELPLSDRVVTALADWVDFYREAGDGLADPEVQEEFVSQGYKIAHGIRRELKGSTVWLERTDSGERVPIELRGPR